MKESVVTYLMRDNTVCLCLKKFGYSKGKWNGFGGKIEKGETPKEAAVREVFEESDVILKEEDLTQVAHFYYHEPGGDWDVVVYICNNFEGTPKETKEMQPEWFDTGNFPLKEMWESLITHYDLPYTLDEVLDWLIEK